MSKIFSKNIKKFLKIILSLTILIVFENNLIITKTEKTRKNQNSEQQVTKTNPAKLKNKKPKWAIIFDLGNTLFKVNKWSIAKEIGIGDFLLYSYWDKHSPTEIQALVFDILHDFEALPTDYPNACSGKLIIPGIMCNWFAGQIKTEQILKKVIPYIEELNKVGFFRNKREKRLVENTIKAMFDAKILAKTMIPVKKGINFLKYLANQKDKNGDNLYEFYILSNWDPASFDYLYKSAQGQKIFKFFKPENIIISGKVGLVKPNPKIYKYILNKFNLDPKFTIFIDDEKINLKIAANIGIKPILLDKLNYKKANIDIQNIINKNK